MASPVRRLSVAFALAFALVSGQVAGWVHALAHATEQAAKKPDGSAPGKLACDQCAAYAGLGAAAAAAAVAPSLVEGAIPALDAASAPVEARTRLPFLSRAPPLPTA